MALEGKGAIDADLSGGFEVEEFVVELGILKEMNAPKVEAEAVDRLHAEGAVSWGPQSWLFVEDGALDLERWPKKLDQGDRF